MAALDLPGADRGQPSERSEGLKSCRGHGKDEALPCVPLPVPANDRFRLIADIRYQVRDRATAITSIPSVTATAMAANRLRRAERGMSADQSEVAPKRKPNAAAAFANDDRFHAMPDRARPCDVNVRFPPIADGRCRTGHPPEVAKRGHGVKGKTPRPSMPPSPFRTQASILRGTSSCDRVATRTHLTCGSMVA